MRTKLLYLSAALLVTLGMSTYAGERERHERGGKATYVGAGRYTCDSDSTGCARVRQGNDDAERSRRAERERREDRADRYTERMREHQRRLSGEKR